MVCYVPDIILGQKNIVNKMLGFLPPDTHTRSLYPARRKTNNNHTEKQYGFGFRWVNKEEIDMLKLDSRRADKIKSILASVIMEGPSKQVTFAFICDG